MGGAGDVYFKVMKRLLAVLPLLALVALIALIASKTPAPQISELGKESKSAPTAKLSPQERPTRVEDAELKVEILDDGLTVRATLTNLSDKPLPYCDVLHTHHTRLGYPWMSVFLRDESGQEMVIKLGYPNHWSPYLLTNDVYTYLRDVETLNLLEPRGTVEVTTSLSKLLLGLPDHVRRRIGTVQVHFSVPLAKNSDICVEAKSEWVTLRKELKDTDLLEGRHPLEVIYVEQREPDLERR